MSICPVGGFKCTYLRISAPEDYGLNFKAINGPSGKLLQHIQEIISFSLRYRQL